MAKNSIRDYSATNSRNTAIQSIDISEGCSPAGINNAIREVMADLKDVSTGTIALESPSADSLSVTGDLTVDTTTLKVDSTNNRVGVGTASPSTALDVVGNAMIDQGSNGGNTLSLDRTSASGSLGLFYNGTQSGLIDAASNGGFNFYVGSTPALMMSVNNIGSMELGNRSYGSGGYGTVLTLRYAGGGTQYGINFLPDADSAQACSFFNASGANIGAITLNASSTVYATSSDYRLKENVSATWDATTRLKQLNPVRFNFIAEPDVTVDGFLAHEAQVVVPESISGTKDAVDEDGNPVYQGIDQSKLVPLLVKTIQELEARITALETA